MASNTFNSLKLFNGDSFIDTEVLNQLIGNQLYLKEVYPTILLAYPGGSHKTEDGDSVRISCGTINIGRFKGHVEKVIRFPSAPKPPGPPVLMLTPKMSKAGVCFIKSFGPGYSTATVRVQTFGGASVAGVQIHWMLIHGIDRG